MNSTDSADRTIRNLRYRPHQIVASWVMGATVVLGIFGLLLSRSTNEITAVLVGSVAIFLGAFLVWVYTESAVCEIQLGSVLSVPPGIHHSPGMIAAIEVNLDPKEDYIELTESSTYREVRIAPRLGSPIRMIVSRSDVSKLREWAVRHRIPFKDLVVATAQSE